MKDQINILILRDCEWWVAQCLEYDIAVQARSLKEVEFEFQRVFLGRMAAAKELGIDPFEGIPPAPEAYRMIFEDANDTVKVELKPARDVSLNISPTFVFPKEALLYAV